MALFSAWKSIQKHLLINRNHDFNVWCLPLPSKIILFSSKPNFPHKISSFIIIGSEESCPGLQGDCQVSLVLLDKTATLAPKSAIYCSLSQVPDQTQLQPWCCPGDPPVGQEQLSTMPWLVACLTEVLRNETWRYQEGVKISFCGEKYDFWRPLEVPNVEIMFTIHY